MRKKTLPYANKRHIEQKTKVRLNSGEIVPAILWGEKGGDLWGGDITYKGKKYKLGHPKKNLPSSAFPLSATEESPFVDFPFKK